MSTLVNPTTIRNGALGLYVTKAYPTLAVETKTLFTVTGGQVLITTLHGLVTTDITVANTVKLQANPTVGTTADLVAATDIGTTDTLAGAILSFDGVAASSIQRGPGAAPTLMRPLVVAAGTIEQVTATGADGGITWALTWIPLTTGATVVAA